VITILHGIGGSHAQGLANNQSDEDHAGVISYPTADFWRVNGHPAASVVGHDPYDFAFHELGKFMALAAKSNPTVLEVLHLTEYLETEPHWGDRLIEIRSAFPSASYVHNAYLGYAESQFRKLMNRGDGKFSSNTGNRVGKHARHTMRLLEQGHRLYTTGELRVQVDEPDYYRWVSDLTPDRLAAEFTRRWGDFTDAETALPAQPDWDRINDYLSDYRRAHIGKA
jgi:predicted nucleotidyltransferase